MVEDRWSRIEGQSSILDLQSSIFDPIIHQLSLLFSTPESQSEFEMSLLCVAIVCAVNDRRR